MNDMEAQVGPSRLVNRNVKALRGRTSMRLEPELWAALEEICRRERTAVGDVVKRVDTAGFPGGRTSAVRVYVLNYFRQAATDAGHQSAGHGSLHDDGRGEGVSWAPGYPSVEPVAA
jgi:predicted DNA-binding ribbon-helix-helix protein